MKNFDWTKFTERIVINAPMEKVYAAWTNCQDLEEWFLSKARVKSSEESFVMSDAMQKGDQYAWNWHCYDVTEYGEVLSANGKNEFTFYFAGKTKVAVLLEDLNNQVLVTLTQSEIPVDDESKKNIRLGCSSGWAFYLVNLKAWLENGVDLRNKDVGNGVVVNG
jgi:uncharacterized protein YndB with AHSA1/START domain